MGFQFLFLFPCVVEMTCKKKKGIRVNYNK
jgi:hypothetical protein